MENWPIDKLLWYRDTLQREFDALYESHEKPLKMRHIGCRLCYVIKLINKRQRLSK